MIAMSQLSWAAMYALHSYTENGGNIEEAVEALGNALSDEKVYVRGIASIILANQASNNPKSIEKTLKGLTKALSDNPKVKEAAVDAIYHCAIHNGNIKEAVKELSEILLDRNDPNRGKAADVLRAFAKNGGNIEEAVGALGDALNDEKIRGIVSVILQEFAAHEGNVDDALPNLIKLLDDENSLIRYVVAATLLEFDANYEGVVEDSVLFKAGTILGEGLP